MLVPRGDRDIGVAYQTHPGNQASSRGEAKNSAVLLSRDGYLLEPTVCPKGSHAYLRLLIFLLTILIPACASSIPAFLMMYSAYKLNKQGDNIQP